MLGVGNSRYAPGTMASFITCLIFIYIYDRQIHIFFLILSTSVIFIFAIYSIDSFKNSFSKVDAKEIVIDEFIGQSIPVLTMYCLIEKNNLNHFIFYTFLSFILFRIFDIWKPYPINKIDQNIKNGFGVMIDDVVAGIYSAALLLVVFIF